MASQPLETKFVKNCMPDNINPRHRVDLKRALEEEMDREEILGKQRAKTQWLAEGDRNTRFVHEQASHRASINEVTGLINAAGELCNDHRDMAEVVNGYF